MWPDESQHQAARSNVLVVSDDPEFARHVVARWQAEPHVPEITLASSDVWHSTIAANYDLVIVSFVPDRQAAILRSLGALPNKPAICVTEGDNDIAALRAGHPHLLVLPKQEGWTSTLILFSSEMLRRVEAVERAHRAERMAIES